MKPGNYPTDKIRYTDRHTYKQISILSYLQWFEGIRQKDRHIMKKEESAKKQTDRQTNNEVGRQTYCLTDTTWDRQTANQFFFVIARSRKNEWEMLKGW